MRKGFLSFESPSRGLLQEEGLSDLSFQKFIPFSKFMGLPMEGNEKEIVGY